jgi:hypothetical protein
MIVHHPVSISIQQDKETELTKVEGRLSYRYAYSRAAETQKEEEVGQDYLTYQVNQDSIIFAICDGVSLSFCGELAAKYLGDRLCAWLSHPAQSNRLDQHHLQMELAEYLSEMVDEASELIRNHVISSDITGLHLEVLEEKRAHGSEATFVCGRIDLPREADSDGRLLVAWLGDTRLRLWGSSGEQTRLLGNTFHTNERWSTAAGPVGSSPHMFITKLNEQDMINRLCVYSDGLSELDSFKKMPADEDIQEVIEASLKKPTSDDISFLDIGWSLASEGSKLPENKKGI